MCTLETSCVILAGGKGLRLRRDKASEIINDKRLLNWVLSGLSFFESEIIIVTAKEQPGAQIVDQARVKIVSDIYPETGPLGGIYSGLVSSDTQHNIVVACDMPFLNQALLDYMLQTSGNFDLVVPRWDGMVEPLHAIYSKSCLPTMENMLKQGILSVTKLFNLVRVRYVETEEIDQFDPKHLSFFNVNTEADLKTARALAKETQVYDKC